MRLLTKRSSSRKLMGAIQPDTLTQDWSESLRIRPCPAFASTICGTPMPPTCSAGVHPKVASERLGHSKIGITLDLYSHVLPGMEADAAERVDAALQAAINRRIKHWVAKR